VAEGVEVGVGTGVGVGVLEGTESPHFSDPIPT
jgi:hypothetical protein